MTMRTLSRTLFSAFIPFLLLAVVATGQPLTVAMSQDASGASILMTSDGSIVYRNLDDSPGETQFPGSFSDEWVPLLVDTEDLSEPLIPSRFGTILRSGVTQSAYLGWPLYVHSLGSMPEPSGAWAPITQEPLLPLVDAWMHTELRDVASGETYRISDFYGRPVLVESFAVWCSICLRQQREMHRFIEMYGDHVVHVSLDTDPNEDELAVQLHLQKHGFSWYYSVAPINMTTALIDAFGLTVVNAPRAPVLLVSPSGTARLLPGGVKTAEELMAYIEAGSDE